jgi:hypothetical protein
MSLPAYLAQVDLADWAVQSVRPPRWTLVGLGGGSPIGLRIVTRVAVRLHTGVTGPGAFKAKTHSLAALWSSTSGRRTDARARQVRALPGRAGSGKSHWRKYPTSP